MLTPECRPNQIARDENEAIWAAENPKTGERYLALFNLSDEQRPVTMDFTELWPEVKGAVELWSGEKAVLRNEHGSISLSESLAPHASTVYKLN